MKDLSDWILTTAAVAVRLMPGLAILSARSLARLVYRVLGPRPEGEGRLGVDHRTETRLGFQLHEAEGPARTGLLTAAVLGRGLIDGYVVICWLRRLS